MSLHRDELGGQGNYVVQGPVEMLFRDSTGDQLYFLRMLIQDKLARASYCGPISYQCSCTVSPVSIKFLSGSVQNGYAAVCSEKSEPHRLLNDRRQSEILITSLKITIATSYKSFLLIIDYPINRTNWLQSITRASPSPSYCSNINS